MSFIPNPLRHVDMIMIRIYEQHIEAFNLKVGEVEMETCTLQNDVQLEAQQGSFHFTDKRELEIGRHRDGIAG